MDFEEELEEVGKKELEIEEFEQYEERMKKYPTTLSFSERLFGEKAQKHLTTRNLLIFIVAIIIIATLSFGLMIGVYKYASNHSDNSNEQSIKQQTFVYPSAAVAADNPTVPFPLLLIIIIIIIIIIPLNLLPLYYIFIIYFFLILLSQTVKKVFKSGSGYNAVSRRECNRRCYWNCHLFGSSSTLVLWSWWRRRCSVLLTLFILLSYYYFILILMLLNVHYYYYYNYNYQCVWIIIS